MVTAPVRRAQAKTPRRIAAEKPNAIPPAKGTRRRRPRAPKPLSLVSRAWRVAGALAISGLAVLAWQLQRLPVELALAYPVMGTLSFGLYSLDKWRASRGAWRLPEGALHVADFGGGIAGGLLGQLMFRHKTSKLPFLVVSASLAALHVAALMLVLSPFGAVLFGTR